MRKYIEYIVCTENRPFSFIDLLTFEANQKHYMMSRGTALKPKESKPAFSAPFARLMIFSWLTLHLYGSPIFTSLDTL